MWITRDKENNDLTLWFNKPTRSYTFWKGEVEMGILLDTNEFKTYSHIKWEDEPVEVHLYEYGKNNSDTYLRMCDQINHLWAMNASLNEECNNLRNTNAILSGRLDKVKKALCGNFD